MVSRLTSIAVGSIVLTAAAFACGGKTAPDDSDPTDLNTSTSQKPVGDDSDDTKTDRANTKTPSGGTTPPGPPGAGPPGPPKPPLKPPPKPPPPPPGPSSCTLQGGSSSGAMDGTSPFCESQAQYLCGSATRTLSCLCQWQDGKLVTGKCACETGNSFAFDCDNGCSPGPKEYARCKLPPLDSSSGG